MTAAAGEMFRLLCASIEASIRLSTYASLDRRGLRRARGARSYAAPGDLDRWLRQRGGRRTAEGAATSPAPAAGRAAPLLSVASDLAELRRRLRLRTPSAGGSASGWFPGPGVRAMFDNGLRPAASQAPAPTRYCLCGTARPGGRAMLLEVIDGFPLSLEAADGPSTAWAVAADVILPAKTRLPA